MIMADSTQIIITNLKKHSSNEILDYITSYKAPKNLQAQEIHQLAMLINEASKNSMNSRA